MPHSHNISSALLNGFLYRSSRGLFRFGFIAICVLYISCAIASETKPVQSPEQTTQQNMEQAWGIRAKSVRLAANGLMVDFRYRIIDSVKASALLQEKKLKPRLVDKASGTELTIPELEKVGGLRTSFKNIVKNKVYFMMFANPNMLIKRGSKVAVIIGDFRAEDLVVQ